MMGSAGRATGALTAEVLGAMADDDLVASLLFVHGPASGGRDGAEWNERWTPCGPIWTHTAGNVELLGYHR